MRIRELFIKRYGPVRDASYALSPSFNLLVGKNEDGKTLTIDALVKLLLGKHVRDFERIDRVAEVPEGYVILENDTGEELKLPEQGDLAQAAGITPSECRNIFVIRDSDLSIAREGEFYTSVTHRLTGLRTEEIHRTKEELREIGQITPTGIFRDIKDELLKTRMERARNSLGELEGVSREIREQGLDALEEESVRLQEELEGVEQGLKRLEEARKRGTYEKGRKALDAFNTALGQAEALNSYSDDDEQTWRDCERDIERYAEEKQGLLAKVRGHERELKATDKTLRAQEGELFVFESRKQQVDQAKAELHIYERKRDEGLQRGQKSALYLGVAVTASLLLGISLLGLIIKPSMPFYLAAPVFFVVAIAGLVPPVQRVRDRAWLAGALGRIKVALARCDMNPDTVEEVYAGIQRFEENYRQRVDEIQGTKRRKENLQEGIAEVLNRALPGVEQKIREAEAQIDRIRRKGGIESRQEYSRRLKSRQGAIQSSDREKGILVNLFGDRGASGEGLVSHWQREFKALEAFRDKSPEVEYDEGRVAQLQDSRHALGARREALHVSMAGFRKRLGEIEREANAILQLETDYLHCTTAVDVEAVKAALTAFMDSNTRTRETVLRVIGIFEAIELEEQGKVAELFGEKRPVSSYFTEITDGLYEGVLFNQERGAVEVRRRDGALLEAGKLSGGAYDQLYLAIRLALGEEMLQGKQGFFIMDDPFVKADPERLQRQIAMLRRIAESGWQVIYVSAKGEMKDAVQKQIRSGTIHYVDIQGIGV